MPLTAILLVLASTFMHAGWNLLSKRRGHQRLYFHRMLLIVVLAGLVPAGWSEWTARSLDPHAWICVLGAGTFCGLYFYFLARSYESSDFTVVYPVARAMPVLLVGLGELGLGRIPTGPGWIGMALVASGCILVPLRSLGDFSLDRYFNRLNLWMLLTALGTVGYTLLDKSASGHVAPGPASAFRYGYVFFVVSYVVYAAVSRPEGSEEEKARVGWRLPAAAACLNFGGYGLVLWAYQLSENAGYVVAFRQFSIVLGVVMGFALFREKGIVIRLGAVAVIAAGLVVIALWGG